LGGPGGGCLPVHTTLGVCGAAELRLGEAAVTVARAGPADRTQPDSETRTRNSLVTGDGPLRLNRALMEPSSMTARTYETAPS
jgi:hypothetical protein